MYRPVPEDPVGKRPEAMLFIGVLYRHEDAYHAAREALTSSFGPISMETPALPWEYSLYYREELGWPILRRFVFFEDFINEDELPGIKLKTIGLEADLSQGGRRTANLDPGYLTPAKVVLATTKDYSHRLCIGRGIYAEVTLIYRKGRFHPHIYTYRDYRDHAGLFLEARKTLLGVTEGHRPFSKGI